MQPIHGLHAGETEALHLAQITETEFVLMDDLDGRKAARLLNLTVVGTVGLLERAAEMELLEFPAAIAKLRQTNFFISPQILAMALERNRLHRRK